MPPAGSSSGGPARREDARMASEQPTRIRRRGFAIIENHVLEAVGREHGAPGIAVYAALARYANYESRCCVPSYQTIADLVGVSRRTAIRMIEKLCASGFVGKRARRDKAGDSAPNEYELLEVPYNAPVDGGVVSQSHHGSDRESLGVVTESHRGGVTESPKQEVLNKRHVNKRDGGGGFQPPEPPTTATDLPTASKAEPEDEDALPPGVEPWEAWQMVEEVPASVLQIARDGPRFLEILARAGLAERDHTWFDSQIAVWRVKRAVRSVRSGTPVWEDLMEWFVNQVRYEQKGASAK